MAKILICTATSTEARACAAGVKDAGLSPDFELLKTGMGLEKAKNALSARLEHGPKPRLIVSTGFAGAFSAGVPLLGWITAEHVYLRRKGIEKSYRAVACPGALVCGLVSSDDLVVKHSTLAQDYANLPKPLSVDMETASLAECAGLAGIPLLVWRMVTDTPEQPLPAFLSAFTSALTAQAPIKARVTLVLSGIKAGANDLRSVARLVKEGPRWAAMLRSGWAMQASRIRHIV